MLIPQRLPFLINCETDIFIPFTLTIFMPDMSSKIILTSQVVRRSGESAAVDNKKCLLTVNCSISGTIHANLTLQFKCKKGLAHSKITNQSFFAVWIASNRGGVDYL